MEIPTEVFDTYYSIASDFIDSNFGVNCTIYYPEKKSICDNCIFDSFQKKSTNKYLAGGPISFTTGQCPRCAGTGYRSIADTDSIKLRAYFDKKKWIKMPVDINLVDSAVQVIGHMVDMPKILRASSVLVNSDIQGYKSFKYVLAGEPVPHGFGRNKYFVAMLTRSK